MAPLKGKFVEAQRRTKYMSKKKKKNPLRRHKETTLETTVPIYRGRASSGALNASSERDTQNAYWDVCVSHAP